MNLRSILLNTIDVDYDDQPKEWLDLQPLLRGMWNSAFLGGYSDALSEYLINIQQNSLYDEIEDKMYFQPHIPVKDIIAAAIRDKHLAQEEWPKVKSIVESQND